MFSDPTKYNYDYHNHCLTLWFYLIDGKNYIIEWRFEGGSSMGGDSVHNVFYIIMPITGKIKNYLKGIE